MAYFVSKTKKNTQPGKQHKSMLPNVAPSAGQTVTLQSNEADILLTSHASQSVGSIHLNNPRLLPIQRQALAANIGQVHGNHRLASLLTTLSNRQMNAPGMRGIAIQRQPDTNDSTTLTQAIASGIHNENRLADLLFFARHPERNHQPIDPQREAALAQEWLAIRNNEVRLALVLPTQARPASGPGSNAALQQAIATGIRNEVQLSDILFFARHPERNGRAIEADYEPHFAQEWLTLRDQIVRPTLAQTQVTQTPNTVPMETSQPVTSAPATTTPPLNTSVNELIASLNHDKLRQLDQITQTLQTLQTAAEAPPTADQSSQERTQWWQSLWSKMNDTSHFAHYKEAGAATVQQMAQLLQTARALTNSLTQEELGVDAGALAKIKGEYQRRLNAFTPYYTQMANLNLLWYNGDIHYDAWMQTCNVTSLAMTLQAAGIALTDFVGDPALMTQIAQRYESRFQSFADVATLRMPDFLQLAVIYLAFGETGGASFEQRVESARGISTTLDIFAQVAALFGVERAYVGYIHSTGEQTFAKSGGEVATAQYKQAVLTQLGPWLDAGGQVVVNQPGHYTRLENVTDSGLDCV